jgi:hypothetical protein
MYHCGFRTRHASIRMQRSRLGPASAILGAALLLLGTALHPMHADPNVPAAAFAEYAADKHWITSHLLQLAGAVAMIAALVLLSRALAQGPGAAWAALGGHGAIASLALASALQAVDGVALKRMVDAWAAATAADKAALFQAAFAVRQVEVGLAAVASLVFGLTVCLYAIALLIDRRLPKWLGALGLAAGAAVAAGGLAIAYSGFSPAAGMITVTSGLLLLAWMTMLGAYGWRRSLF